MTISQISPLPVLWSFRRCPYAIRARLAIQSAGVTVELREILLRDKPDAFRAASPSATVPCLETDAGVIDESRDIMTWALAQSDPEDLCAMPDIGNELIDTCDGPFKTALDHTKYAVRYPDRNTAADRAKAAEFLHDLNRRLAQNTFLTADRCTLADLAIFPFVRQFAGTDPRWFAAQDWPHLLHWLDDFTQSDRFASVMAKYTPWTPEQDVVLFP